MADVDAENSLHDAFRGQQMVNLGGCWSPCSFGKIGAGRLIHGEVSTTSSDDASLARGTNMVLKYIHRFDMPEFESLISVQARIV